MKPPIKLPSLVLIVLAMASTGCAHPVHMLTVDPSAPEGDVVDTKKKYKFSEGFQLLKHASVVEINNLGARKKATVTLVDQRKIKVRSLQVTPDSTSWLNAGTNQFESVATAEIYEVRFAQAGRGALEGLRDALLFSATLAVLGFAAGDDPDSACSGKFWCSTYTAGEKALLYPAVVGLPIGLVWVSMGALRGNDIVHFEAPVSTPPVAPVAAAQKNPLRE